jgi:FAD/FMN-containing dehydrogenase
MSPQDRELVAALTRAGVAEVDGSALARALYSSDASLYRVRPRVVVRPRHRDEIAAAL